MCNVCTSVTPGEPQVILGSDKAFTYNYVFDMDDKQEMVYDTCVASLVDSSLEGYDIYHFNSNQKFSIIGDF